MRKFIILFCFFVFGILAFGEIYDDAKLLNNDERNAMEQKLGELEKSFEVKFKIIISKEEIDIKKYTDNFSKGVIIHLKKDEKENKLIVRLYFSKDIDINTYKEEMQKILDDSQPLVDDGKYVDLIYEITGSISELINLINAEEKAAMQKTVGIVAAVILFFIAAGGLTLVLILRREKNKKKNLCRFCDIEMDLVDEYQENNKTIRLYNCHVCGHSKKISFRH